MKLHWGTGIVLAFIGFISFILYFIITINVDDTFDTHLVTEDYYKAELTYQNDIDKLHNATNLSEDISYVRSVEGLVLKFPSDIDITKVTGNVFLYRPSNKQLDFETAISLSDHYLLIPDQRLVDGRWNIQVDWQYNGQSYLYKDIIHY